MTTETKTWPAAVWEAINTLADRDLAHYRHHVHDREAFLGTARAKRVAQHHTLIHKLLAGNPNITSTELVEACSPAPVTLEPEVAKRRDYDHTRRRCGTCDSVRFVPVMQDVERWAPCPTCNPRKDPTCQPD